MAGLSADVCVVGGGVVGAAVCRELVSRGLSVTLVERGDVGGGVSAGNTGIACTLLGVPEGSLERRCLEVGRGDNLATYHALGIPHKPSGALYVAWTERELAMLPQLAAQGQDENAQILSAEALAEHEPKLGPGALGALLVPGEVVVDPGLVPLALTCDALSLGASVLEGTEVAELRRNHQGLWQISLRAMRPQISEPSVLQVRHVVNCAGLAAGSLDGKMHIPAEPLQFKPRRGDYLVFRRPAEVLSPPLNRPIGSVPEQSSRGVYVWATVHGDVACGPTNSPQDNLDLPAPSSKTLTALHARALQVCPDLSNWTVAGCYSGLRPALDARRWGEDYQLDTNAELAYTVVAGIRSTGLTASLGIASMVADGITRPSVGPRSPVFAPLPSIAQLRQDFAARGDGKVDLHGRAFRVRHPLTLLGLGAALPQKPCLAALHSGSAAWGGSRFASSSVVLRKALRVV